MLRDRTSSELAPTGWTVWTDGRRFQAIRDGVIPHGADPPNAHRGSKDWGPRRKLASQALQDARELAAIARDAAAETVIIPIPTPIQKEK